MNTEPGSTLLQHLKGHTPSYLSLLGTMLLWAFMTFGNVRAGSQHTTDEAQQLKDRVTKLELQVANDLATRSELKDFKADATNRLNRIEDKLDKEIEFHRTH